ncbi:MAG TPA: hypothetical protein VFY18_10455 [Candidatus Limnocylindrales bacterium]|nr:hypothetical protein [Candidatus Limnocylindrales bacterium]
MQPLLILPLIAFLILLVLFALVLRRAGRFLAQTRDVERFRRQVGDLGSRVERSLNEVSVQVDAVRRGQVGADALGDDLNASLDAVAKYAEEAKALRPPSAAASIRNEIVGELERVARALEMIEHGRSIQTSARSGGRELEAQTSIKRGYLNVLHAREAIARQRQAAADLIVGDGPDRFQCRRA